MTQNIDVAIIGAGPAGLQAALSIGRVHRSATVFDSGVYRNDPTEHMHNLIAHDGQSPSALRAASREDISRYDTVSIVEASVDTVAGASGDFTLTTSAGTYRASRVILATGMRDTLPYIPACVRRSGPLPRTARSATGTSTAIALSPSSARSSSPSTWRS